MGVGTLPLAPDLAHLQTALLGRYPVCLVGTADMAWTRLKRPGLASLHGQPVVMPGEGFTLHRHLHDWWRAHGVTPHVVAESGQWDFLLSMAQAGMGMCWTSMAAKAWAATPWMVVQALSMPRDRADGPPVACAISVKPALVRRARRTRVPVPPPSTPMR